MTEAEVLSDDDRRMCMAEAIGLCNYVRDSFEKWNATVEALKEEIEILEEALHAVQE